MLRVRSIIVAMVAITLSFSGVAGALLLEDKSAEQKHRADVAKQAATLAKCLGKVWEKCEKMGEDPLLAECFLATGLAAVTVDPNAAAQFAPGIAKCISKLDLMKKAPDGATELTAYQAIGCPGAPDDSGYDMDDYQAEVAESLKVSIDQLGLIPLTSGCDPTDDKCVFDEVKRFNKFTQGLAKCFEKCENDYKNTKGNGGGVESSDNCSAGGRCVDNDATCFSDANCLPGTPNCVYTFNDVNFRACADKIFETAVKKSTWPPLMEGAVLSLVLQQLNVAKDATYNSPSGCIE
jgi:hypothetical protein